MVSLSDGKGMTKIDWSLIDVELREFYGIYKNASTIEEQTKWANEFRWELARHSVGEELVLHPAFEKHLGAAGKRIVEEDRVEHQAVRVLGPSGRRPVWLLTCRVRKIKEILYNLERMNVADAGYDAKFKKLFEDLEAHMRR